MNAQQSAFLKDGAVWIFGICYDTDGSPIWSGPVLLRDATLLDYFKALLRIPPAGRLTGPGWNPPEPNLDARVTDVMVRRAYKAFIAADAALLDVESRMRAAIIAALADPA